jgi:single-stranded-DNA-specific exonuclease
MFLASNVRVVGEPRAVGADRKHLQLKLGQGDSVFKAVGWSMAERFKGLAHGVECSVVFQASIDEWQGQRRVQLEVKDLLVPGAPPMPPEPVAAVGSATPEALAGVR